MGDKYKLRLPVLSRLCANCGLEYGVHVDGKCLFEPTTFAPGKVMRGHQTVHADIKSKKPPPK